MGHTYKYIFILATLFLAGCDRPLPEDGPSPQEPCDLVLDLTVPKITLGTKGQYIPGSGNKIVDDPFIDPSGWTAWERALDGQGMYRLTVFLINMSDGGKLVGYRNIYKATESDYGDIYAEGSEEGANGWVDNYGNVDPALHYGNKAKISFIYDHPVHKNADGESPERLVRGNYRIVVFANCSACYEVLEGQPGSTPYEGLANKAGEKISTYSDGIINEFKTSLESYPDGKVFSSYEDYDELYNWMLEAAIGSDSKSEYLCKPTPMPLTLVKDIELQPGMNEVSGNLLRARSRVRITVENNSQYPLTIKDLSFSTNFSKENSYLFDDPDNPGRVYDIYGVTKGAPNPKSDNALVSFPDAGVVIPGIDASGSKSAVLFDGYVLESRDLDNIYSYTLDMEYAGVDYTRTIYTLPQTYTAITEYNSSEIDDGGYYLINSVLNTNWFFRAKEGIVNVNADDSERQGISSFEGIEIENEYVWKLESQGTANCWYISTGDETVYYIGTAHEYNYGNVPMVPEKTSSPYYTFGAGYNSANISALGSEYYNGHYYYLNVNSDWQKLGGWYGLDQGSTIRLYRLKQEVVEPKYSSPIKLQTIDPVLGKVDDVHTTARNDFINILVTVSLNKDTGDFEFVVKDWGEKEYGIEFN